MIIPSIYQKIKHFTVSERGGEILLSICILLFGTLAFGIGKWSTVAKTRNNADPVVVTMAASSLKTEPLRYFDGPKGTTSAAAILASSTSAPQSRGVFVASKNGTKYYPSDCSGADRIKPENTVWFATEADAQKAGYERTVTCK